MRKPNLMYEDDDFVHTGPQYRLRGRALEEAVAAERRRCAKIVQDHADKWNAHARALDGACAESLADECEDIVQKILNP